MYFTRVLAGEDMKLLHGQLLVFTVIVFIFYKVLQIQYAVNLFFARAAVAKCR